MTKIKFIGSWLTDIPSLKPVMDYMNVKDIYGASPLIDAKGNIPNSWKNITSKFGLTARSLAELDKSDLLIDAWSPLMLKMFEKGYKNHAFMVHGVSNYCGCWNENRVKDRYELVAGDYQRDARIKNGKEPDKIFAVGYPRLDELGKHPEVDLELREEILGNKKPTILWAPPGHKFYVEQIMPIMVKLGQQNDVNIICKLHSGGGHYMYRGKLKSDYIRIVWDDEYTSTPLKMISDMLLSGKSSVSFGFVLTDRPIFTSVLLPGDSILKDHRDANQLEKEEIADTLINAIDSPQNYVNKEERLNMRNYIFSNIGCATEKVAEKIMEIANRIL